MQLRQSLHLKSPSTFQTKENLISTDKRGIIRPLSLFSQDQIPLAPVTHLPLLSPKSTIKEKTVSIMIKNQLKLAATKDLKSKNRQHKEWEIKIPIISVSPKKRVRFNLSGDHKELSKGNILSHSPFSSMESKNTEWSKLVNTIKNQASLNFAMMKRQNKKIPRMSINDF